MHLQKLDLTSLINEAKRQNFVIEVREKAYSSCNGVVDGKRKFNIVSLPGPHVIVSLAIPRKERKLPNVGYILVNEISRQVGARPFCRYGKRGLVFWEWLPKDWQYYRFEMIRKLTPQFHQWNNGIFSF